MRTVTAALVLFIPLAAATPALAQFGVGGRLAMIRGDVSLDTNAERFTGGHIRAGISPRTAFELAVDVRTETDDALTRRVREYPLQASLLVFPVRAAIGPYVLGGGGWYTTRVEPLGGSGPTEAETTREFGWHGGFGAELRLGRHAGAHADYRYTFLRFGEDDEEDGAPAPRAGGSRFLPSYRGSMWTAGLTLYF